VGAVEDGYMLGDKTQGCVFCLEAERKTTDRKNYILYPWNKEPSSIMNIYPYNNSHLMVIPLQARQRHLKSSPDSTLKEMMV
jgi:diadenosine tetraphosphate (Ap4A) HIT family hydrolase